MAPAHAHWDPYPKSSWAYAHGWGDRPGPGTWGTVMCYNTGRLATYSNPHVTINGHVCGNADSADNARVIGENPSGINNWRLTPADTIIQSDTISGQQYGDVVASNSISTNSSVRVLGELKLRATNAVTLNSGFFAVQGSNLTITTGTGALAKTRSDEGGERRILSTPQTTLSAPVISSIKAVTVNKTIRIDYICGTECYVQYALYSLDGKRIVSKVIGLQSSGSYTLRVAFPRRSNQMLVLVVKVGNVIYEQPIRRL